MKFLTNNLYTHSIANKLFSLVVLLAIIFTSNYSTALDRASADYDFQNTKQCRSQAKTYHNRADNMVNILGIYKEKGLIDFSDFYEYSSLVSFFGGYYLEYSDLKFHVDDARMHLSVSRPACDLIDIMHFMNIFDKHQDNVLNEARAMFTKAAKIIHKAEIVMGKTKDLLKQPVIDDQTKNLVKSQLKLSDEQSGLFGSKEAKFTLDCVMKSEESICHLLKSQ